MAIRKITEQEMDANGVCAAPDILNGTTAENKAVFDRMIRQVVAPAYNACAEAVDQVEARVPEWEAAEQARQEAESGRETAEHARVLAEEARAAAEQSRQAAETQRETAETQRKDAEIKREDQETGYIAQAKYWAGEAQKAAGGGVTSFNGRSGTVVPEAGDYTPEMVGAAPAIETATAQETADQAQETANQALEKASEALIGASASTETKKQYGLDAAATNDAIFNILKNASIYKKVVKKPAVILKNVSEGSIVQLIENGKPEDFFVAKHNYEEGLNGRGRTLLLRKNLWNPAIWNNSNRNEYAGGSLDSYLNTDTTAYKKSFDSKMQAAMGTTKIPCTIGGGDPTVATLQRSVFVLSATELGKTESWVNVEGSVLPNVSLYQRLSELQWTRSPNKDTTNQAAGLSNNTLQTVMCTASPRIRPAFTLPEDFEIAPEERDDSLHTILGEEIMKIPPAHIVTGVYIGTGVQGSTEDVPIHITTPYNHPKVIFITSAERGRYSKHVFCIAVFKSYYQDTIPGDVTSSISFDGSQYFYSYAEFRAVDRVISVVPKAYINEKGMRYEYTILF